MTTHNGISYQLYTIGHSNHPIDVFLSLLHEHRITAVADVRSQPYSRLNSQFNHNTLQATCRLVGMKYVFLGRELGARRSECDSFEDDRVSYKRVRELPAFVAGMSRLRKGVQTNRIVLLCAEKDPLFCHRAILICRELRGDQIDIRHIAADGSLETMAEMEVRLVREWRLPEMDMFDEGSDLLEAAYDQQAERIAFRKHQYATPSTDVAE